MDDLKSATVASIRINWKALGLDPHIIVENCERIKGRMPLTLETKEEPIALVAYGPSLRETWKEIRKFDTVMTCSGAYKFLVDRGITPDYHCESDPRPHKVAMLGIPQPGTTYLMASCCHQNYFDLLEKHEARVLLWHLLFDEDEIYRLYPKGEWIITGSNTIGPRMLRLARLSGYTNIHLFGLDGSGQHAGYHTNAPGAETYSDIVYKGKTYTTTKQLMYQAASLFDDLDRIPELNVTMYGDGLYQAMHNGRTRRELERWPLAIQR